MKIVSETSQQHLHGGGGGGDGILTTSFGSTRAVEKPLKPV